MASNQVMASNLIVMASNLIAMASNLRAMASHGLQPSSDGLQPNSDGLQPSTMASTLIGFVFSQPDPGRPKSGSRFSKEVWKGHIHSFLFGGKATTMELLVRK